MGKKKNYMMIMVVVEVILLFDVINGDLQRFQHSTKAKADGSLSLLVVGDWGRKGTYNQSKIATQMGKVGEKMEIDFVISTGDNFYDDGLINTLDPAFRQSFTDIYTAPSLQTTWYNVLGNHDYRGDALAQVSPVLKARDSRWFCKKSYILETENAEFFFIDTTPFQDKYFTDPEDHVYDWRGVHPRATYLATLLKDVEKGLQESTARWKIVVGHHTIKSASDHGNTQELVDKLLPILEANGVDLYINGHDHCLQHISSPNSPLQFVTSGGGSKAWRGVYNWGNPNEMKFFYDGQGFMSLHINIHHISINFFDISANILHKWAAATSPNPTISISAAALYSKYFN